MAKRDPAKTARNKRITDMKEQLRKLLPTVLKETGFADVVAISGISAFSIASGPSGRPTSPTASIGGKSS